jgi:OmpA-OmpF porin, OOP family
MKFAYAAATALVLTLSGMSANAQTVKQDTANDGNKNIITNTFGNCVRTKWEAAGDACAPEAPAPAPAPVAAAPAPAPVAMPSREARSIYFDFNKATLTPDSIAKLNDLVSYVARSKQVDGAGIAGFADRIGGDDYNLELSKKRAKAVYDYLSQRVKINTEILDIRALGENSPQTTCSDKMKRNEQIACLAKDRRVEVVFQYQN